jgi:hypothetical protein
LLVAFLADYPAVLVVLTVIPLAVAELAACGMV